MRELSIDDLHVLRTIIYDNAEQLYKESTLLFESGHHARAYLLAHLCCEELGKIPIVVGVIGCLVRGEPVDWKRALKRFRDHKLKIDADDFHHFMFAIEPDPLRDRDLHWLRQANQTAASRVGRKNAATYVDVDGKTLLSPLTEVTRDDAVAVRERAFASLRTHWHAECLINPIIVEARAKLKASSRGETGKNE